MLWSDMLKLFIVVVLVGVAAGIMLAVVNASLPSGYTIRVEATATLDHLPDGRRVVLGKILVTCSGDCSSATLYKYEVRLYTPDGYLILSCDNSFERPLSPGLNTVPFACFESVVVSHVSKKYYVHITAYISGNIYRSTVTVSG